LDFLQARQSLLAQAANEFLNSLLTGPAPEPTVASVSLVTTTTIPDDLIEQSEDVLVKKTNQWIADHGLPEGEVLYQLTNALTGELLALLDLAWPEGLQTGYSDPIALLLEEDAETLEVASCAGFRCFTDVKTFQAYVESQILALETV
jgi:hypothetical protein